MTNKIVACSQTLYFLFKVRRARVIQNKNCGGFIDSQFKGGSMLVDVFEKNEKKNKTTTM